MSKQYRVVKFYEDGRRRRVIRSGLDLEQARAICNDPETSSYSASRPRGCANNKEAIARWHKNQKHWFYGFEEY